MSDPPRLRLVHCLELSETEVASPAEEDRSSLRFGKRDLEAGNRRRRCLQPSPEFECRPADQSGYDFGLERYTVDAAHRNGSRPAAPFQLPLELIPGRVALAMRVPRQHQGCPGPPSPRQ